MKERLFNELIRSLGEAPEHAEGKRGLMTTRVPEHHPATELSDRDRDIFLSVLDQNAKPNDLLIGAAKTHRKLIIE